MKNIIIVISISFLSILSLNTYAATINGSFGIIGDLNAVGGTDLSSVTGISLSKVWGTDGSLNDTSNVTFFSTGAGGTTASLTGATLPASSFLTIEGWNFQLTTLNVIDQRSNLLSLKGSGSLSGNGYDTTNAIWSFSTGNMTSYNMTVSTVPLPAAVWLFGSGLLGLAGIARRRKA